MPVGVGAVASGASGSADMGCGKVGTVAHGMCHYLRAGGPCAAAGAVRSGAEPTGRTRVGAHRGETARRAPRTVAPSTGAPVGDPRPPTPPEMTTPYGSGTSSIVDRMRGAALLDIPTYEAVEHDTTATGQAAVVVALAAIAAAVGNLFRGGPGLIGALVGYLVGWIAWSGITYVVGTRIFGGTATWGELLRTLGFAQAPGVLLVAAIIPGLGILVKVAVGIWLLVTGLVAIRQALDVTTGKAVLTALLGWVASVVINGLIAGLLGVRVY